MMSFAAFRSISNEYRTAYNAKAENSVEFSAFLSRAAAKAASAAATKE
ncbi:MAG: hypothetical protein MJY69_07920 [Bacteroidales bacterium]|nr:hypothetical protein [Bacteroidales bacterium]